MGEQGRLDVLVDGERVASRSENWFLQLLGLGYPEPAQVVALLEQRARSTPEEG